MAQMVFEQPCRASSAFSCLVCLVVGCLCAFFHRFAWFVHCFVVHCLWWPLLDLAATGAAVTLNASAAAVMSAAPLRSLMDMRTSFVGFGAAICRWPICLA